MTFANPGSDRVLVIGTSASGKTTFARRLGAIVDAPVVELDALHWMENWQERPLDDFSKLVEQATAGPAWITDGCYSHIREMLWPKATLVVWLNYSLPRVFWQGLERTVRRSLRREELWNGNRESLSKALLTKDSILLWILTSFHRRRREFNSVRDSGDYPHLRWIEFTHPSQTNNWLQRAERDLAGETTRNARNSSPDPDP